MTDTSMLASLYEKVLCSLQPSIPTCWIRYLTNVPKRGIEYRKCGIEIARSYYHPHGGLFASLRLILNCQQIRDLYHTSFHNSALCGLVVMLCTTAPMSDDMILELEKASFEKEYKASYASRPASFIDWSGLFLDHDTMVSDVTDLQWDYGSRSIAQGAVQALREELPYRLFVPKVSGKTMSKDSSEHICDELGEAYRALSDIEMHLFAQGFDVSNFDTVQARCRYKTNSLKPRLYYASSADDVEHIWCGAQIIGLMTRHIECVHPRLKMMIESMEGSMDSWMLLWDVSAFTTTFRHIYALAFAIGDELGDIPITKFTISGITYSTAREEMYELGNSMRNVHVMYERRTSLDRSTHTIRELWTMINGGPLGRKGNIDTSSIGHAFIALAGLLTTNITIVGDDGRALMPDDNTLRGKEIRFLGILDSLVGPCARDKVSFASDKDDSKVSCKRGLKRQYRDDSVYYQRKQVLPLPSLDPGLQGPYDPRYQWMSQDRVIDIQKRVSRMLFTSFSAFAEGPRDQTAEALQIMRAYCTIVYSHYGLPQEGWIRSTCGPKYPDTPALCSLGVNPYEYLISQDHSQYIYAAVDVATTVPTDLLQGTSFIQHGSGVLSYLQKLGYLESELLCSNTQRFIPQGVACVDRLRSRLRLVDEEEEDESLNPKYCYQYTVISDVPLSVELVFDHAT